MRHVKKCAFCQRRLLIFPRCWRFMRLDCAVGSAFLNAYYQSMGYQAAGAFREGDYYEGIRREKALEKSGEDTK